LGLIDDIEFQEYQLSAKIPIPPAEIIQNLNSALHEINPAEQGMNPIGTGLRNFLSIAPEVSAAEELEINSNTTNLGNLEEQQNPENNNNNNNTNDENLENDEEEFQEDMEDEEEAPNFDICAPQVKVINGQIVIDQQSLILPVETTNSQPLTKVFVKNTTKYNPAAFGRRGKIDRWSDTETDQFYQVVRMTTDFSLIQQLFPNRTRTQIKNKFKKEERENPRQLDWCFKNPISLDFELFRGSPGLQQQPPAQPSDTTAPDKPNNDNEPPKEEQIELKTETLHLLIKQPQVTPLVPMNNNNNDPYELDDEDDYNTPYINGVAQEGNNKEEEEEAGEDKEDEPEPEPEALSELENPKSNKSTVNSIEDAFSFF